MRERRQQSDKDECIMLSGRIACEIRMDKGAFRCGERELSVNWIGTTSSTWQESLTRNAFGCVVCQGSLENKEGKGVSKVRDRRPWS